MSKEADEAILQEYRVAASQYRSMLITEQSNSKRNSRRWATLVILLLVLGALGFGAVTYRQFAIVDDLKDQAKVGCEARNVNEALLHQTWVNLSNALRPTSPEVAQVYADAATAMKPPRDCSIYVK